MGASKFSLKVIAELLRPSIKHLLFRPLKEFVDKTTLGKRLEEGSDYDLIQTLGGLTLPATIALSDMVYPLVTEYQTYRPNTLRAIVLCRFYAKRYSTDEHVTWLLENTTFRPRTPGSRCFESDAGKIQVVRDEDLEGPKILDLDIKSRLWTAIDEWHGVSLEVREKPIVDLKSSRQACHSRWVKETIGSSKKGAEEIIRKGSFARQHYKTAGPSI